MIRAALSLLVVLVASPAADEPLPLSAPPVVRYVPQTAAKGQTL